jgi:hypothetical protein
MSTTTKASLKMFIASEDKVAFLRARQLERQLQALSDDEMEIIPVFWNFSLLRHPGLRECATLEAADAEMIVVSVHKNGELPTHVQCWLESLPVRVEGTGAMVAMVGAPEAFLPGTDSCISYLRQIAANRGYDFICNQDNREPADTFESNFSSFDPGRGRALTPARRESNPVLWHAGDLND